MSSWNSITFYWDVRESNDSDTVCVMKYDPHIDWNQFIGHLRKTFSLYSKEQILYCSLCDSKKRMMIRNEDDYDIAIRIMKRLDNSRNPLKGFSLFFGPYNWPTMA